MWRRIFFSAVLTLALAASVTAEARPFPANAKRGKMTPAPYPQIVIDGSSRHLSPGARIWGDNNLIQMPASLRGSELAVNYTEDSQNQIDRVWILTAEEASEPIAQQTNTQPR